MSFVDNLEGLLRIKIERRKMESFVQTIGLSAAGGRRSEQKQSHANQDPYGHGVTLVCHFVEFQHARQWVFKAPNIARLYRFVGKHA